MNIKKAVSIFLLLLLLIVACFFIFRNSILEIAIEKVKQKFAERNYVLTTGESGFDGIAVVFIKNVSLVPQRGDTLLLFENAAASLSFVQFIKGNFPVDDLRITNGFIHLTNYSDTTNNYSRLLENESVSIDTTATEQQKLNFRKMFNGAWRNFSKLSGLNLQVTDFNISLLAPGYAEQLAINNFGIENSGFELDAGITSSIDTNSLKILGTIDPSAGLVEFHGSSADNKITYFPFLKKISGVNLFAETFGGSMKIVNENTDHVQLNIHAAAVRPGVNHWRIGPDDVLLDSLGINISIVIKNEEIEITAPSHFIVNRLPMSIEAAYRKSDDTRVMLKAGFENVESEAFFNSLPHGLFNSLEGIKTTGELSYNLHLEVDPNQPDSLIFDTELKGHDLKIKGYGTENFSYINNDFTYEARENDRVVRVIKVGPENTFYTPLTDINLMLIGCVLVAEDGTYFFHRGFNHEAFRKSMATNIKEKRFARGGSTITMQLVKNVFLSRNKTISRKVEEALIVWLIENERIVSKERMLEVYLNIIEWGPGVYGIGEAADFYFSKKPFQLNLDEAIFLSSIIPRPKYFKYSFAPDGSLREYLRNYYDVVSGRLLKKEIITQTEIDQMSYRVELKGRALNIVMPPDTIPADSIYIDNAGDIFN